MMTEKNSSHILLVDGDKARLSRLVDVCKKRLSSYKAASASTLTEAQRHLRQHDPLLVLAACTLPDGGIGTLQKEVVETPIIVMGSPQEYEALAGALERGACCFITRDEEGMYLRLLPTVLRKVLQQRRSDVQLAQEIGDRRQAEQALEREQDLLQKLMETIPVGIMLVDLDGRITFANNWAAQMMDMSKETILSLNYNAPEWQIRDFEGNKIPRAQLPFIQVKKSEKPIRNSQLTVTNVHGKQVYLLIHGAPLFNTNNEIEQIVFILEDITLQERERKSLEFLSTPVKSHYTAAAFRQQSLREAHNTFFHKTVTEYADLLDLSLENQMYRVHHDIAQKLRSIAQALSNLEATPRDVIEIHITALKRGKEELPEAKRNALASEGRVMVLELMGYLAAYYRTFFISDGEDKLVQEDKQT